MKTRLTELLKFRSKDPLNDLRLEIKPSSAAVLLLLYNDGDENHVVFTKRSEFVEHHKGQICFPGGVKDDQDPTLWHTALRETHEEIGLEPQRIHYVGELRPVTTPTGFKVTPFVGYAQPPFQWKINEREIAQIFTAPLPHFLEAKNLRIEKRVFNEQEISEPFFLFEAHEIWGATGRILMDFLEVWRQAAIQQSLPHK